MDERLKSFLEKNKHLIKENRWSVLYQNAWSAGVDTSLANFLFDGLCQETMLDCFSAEGKIPDFAFESCESLTSITIPNSVTSIGNYAFFDCGSLPSIEFDKPSSVTSIGILAFQGCKSLPSITIPKSVTYIGYWAFEGCECHIIFECDKKVVTENVLKGFNGTYEFK